VSFRSPELIEATSTEVTETEVTASVWDRGIVLSQVCLGWRHPSRFQISREFCSVSNPPLTTDYDDRSYFVRKVTSLQSEVGRT